ncbi:UNVERIFIED_CONTAM: hypothetical protein Sangu_2535200 [Sesamum angustifolium]|uniref:Uncharacterized protein n=1 Tax=Sesamum angustifolium TaxID=2727405 RepID=A0AAW2JAF0_9LAMI
MATATTKPNHEDRMIQLETMMVDMMAMMREMQASSLTTGPSQPTASTSALAQPSIDSLAPNEDDMNIAD